YLIKERKPKSVLNFGIYRGYSTLWFRINSDVEVAKSNWSFELFRDHEPYIKKNLERYDIEYKDIYYQDILKAELPDSIDFCFVDGEHSKKFAEGYIKKIFPKISPGGLICIHDISSKKIGQNENFESNV